MNAADCRRVWPTDRPPSLVYLAQYTTGSATVGLHKLGGLVSSCQHSKCLIIFESTRRFLRKTLFREFTMRWQAPRLPQLWRGPHQCAPSHTR